MMPEAAGFKGAAHDSSEVRQTIGSSAVESERQLL